ncbi:acyl-CoA dehydrogenase FadE [Mycobacteroides abscessus subsp. abscessus]|nr:acyl-CoA dehydrogenase FadE [Mycobacteroides abscessus subsp. abscessus]
MPSELLHETLETPLPWPPPFWKGAAEQGLTSVHLAESVGGQGFGALELAIVVAEFGRGAVPGPFVPSVIASALISAHDPVHRDACRRWPERGRTGTLGAFGDVCHIRGGAGRHRLRAEMGGPERRRCHS